MLHRFRNDLRLQAWVLGILGVALLIVAGRVQVPLWLAARGIVIHPDCDRVNVYERTFRALLMMPGNPQLQMRDPRWPELSKIEPDGARIPPQMVREHLAKSAVDFGIFWRILEGDTVLEKGFFRPSDLTAISYTDHVSYSAEDYTGHYALESGKKYTLIVEVDKPCAALSEFEPVVLLGPPIMKDFASFSRRLTLWTVPSTLLGLLLLGVAGSKRWRLWATDLHGPTRTNTDKGEAVRGSP